MDGQAAAKAVQRELCAAIDAGVERAKQNIRMNGSWSPYGTWVPFPKATPIPTPPGVEGPSEPTADLTEEIENITDQVSKSDWFPLSEHKKRTSPQDPQASPPEDTLDPTSLVQAGGHPGRLPDSSSSYPSPKRNKVTHPSAEVQEAVEASASSSGPMRNAGPMMAKFGKNTFANVYPELDPVENEELVIFGDSWEKLPSN